MNHPTQHLREFLGVWIPAKIWNNENLNIPEKCLWAEIQSLHDDEVGGCYANNDYLSKKLNVSISTVKKSLKNLIDLGFVKQVNFNRRQRILSICELNNFKLIGE